MLNGLSPPADAVAASRTIARERTTLVNAEVAASRPTP